MGDCPTQSEKEDYRRLGPQVRGPVRTFANGTVRRRTAADEIWDVRKLRLRLRVFRVGRVEKDGALHEIDIRAYMGMDPRLVEIGGRLLMARRDRPEEIGLVLERGRGRGRAVGGGGDKWQMRR